MDIEKLYKPGVLDAMAEERAAAVESAKTPARISDRIGARVLVFEEEDATKFSIRVEAMESEGWRLADFTVVWVSLVSGNTSPPIFGGGTWTEGSLKYIGVFRRDAD